MSVAKIDFRTNEVLIDVFLYPNSSEERKKFKKRAKEFSDFWKIWQASVLEGTAKYLGYPWKIDRIPVYLVPWGPHGFISRAKPHLTDGLPGVIQLIGIGNRGQEVDIQVFIHELVHVCQHQSEYRQSKHYKDRALTEMIADLVNLYVIRDVFGLNSVYETEYWSFFKLNERQQEKHRVLSQYLDQWDLNRLPVVEYLKKKNPSEDG
jgi:hypothetical protein